MNDEAGQVGRRKTSTSPDDLPGFGIAAMRYSTSGPILEQGKLVVKHQCQSDGHVHIQVLIGTQTATEEDGLHSS